MSDSSRLYGLQPTRLFRPWDFPGKSTGVGCHRLQGPLGGENLGPRLVRKPTGFYPLHQWRQSRLAGRLWARRERAGSAPGLVAGEHGDSQLRLGERVLCGQFLVRTRGGEPRALC